MIKSFSNFSSSRIFEGEEHLIQNMAIIPGSNDYQVVRNFIKEVTNGKLPPSNMTNILQLVKFCVDNYFAFNYPEEKGALKPAVDKIKEGIMSFFKSVELEEEWFDAGDEGKTYAVDAVFKNTRKGTGWGRGMLQRFFDIFWYIRTHPNETSAGLDEKANLLIREAIQEIKETWDPEGWDPYVWGLGGDSDAIKSLNRKFLEMYGGYAIMRGELLAKQAAQQTPEAQPKKQAVPGKPSQKARPSQGPGYDTTKKVSLR